MNSRQLMALHLRAQDAGLHSLADYTLELEDILQALVDATERDDFEIALNRARQIVWRWTK